MSDLTHRLTATDGDLHASAAAYVSFARSRPHAFDLITHHDLLEDSGQQLRQETVPLLDGWIDLYRSRHPNADKTEALSAWVGVHGIATLESRRAFRVIPADADALLERMLA
ncbi:MAG: TetR-like C-terminal domain-containing protein [Pseudoclavibacter sp.]